MKYAVIIAMLLLAGYLILAYRRKLWPFKSKASVVIDDRQEAIIATLRVMDNGPGFPTVWSVGGISQDVQGGIEDAFTERIAAAKAKGWKDALDPRLYTMYVFPSVRDTDTNGDYSPVFQVFLPKASPYIGSEYDHGGWIFAAEQVMTTGNVPKNAFIIAANNSRAYTARVTSYALDHLFAWHNDRALYERTKNHSSSGGHPLW